MSLGSISITVPLLLKLILSPVLINYPSKRIVGHVATHVFVLKDSFYLWFLLN